MERVNRHQPVGQDFTQQSVEHPVDVGRHLRLLQARQHSLDSDGVPLAAGRCRDAHRVELCCHLSVGHSG